MLNAIATRKHNLPGSSEYLLISQVCNSSQKKASAGCARGLRSSRLGRTDSSFGEPTSTCNNIFLCLGEIQHERTCWKHMQDEYE